MQLWLIGDIASIVGTVVQGLLHTLIILGVVNSVIDIALMWQCYHYAKWEQFIPFLIFLRIRQPNTSTSELPSRTPASPDPTLVLPPPDIPQKSRLSTILHTVYVLTVVGLSIMVWGLVVARVRKAANLHAGEDGTNPNFSPVGAAFGWTSAIIYITSRCPQIYKNWRFKSCHNLSIWIFVLLVIYNLTNLAVSSSSLLHHIIELGLNPVHSHKISLAQVSHRQPPLGPKLFIQRNS
ncbi:hypothetical protein FRC08_002851 [Ceratobasidium sp. 394]|nr:hypothetical protein FRC08_002851 [Ceratobasidium sp. 394]